MLPKQAFTGFAARYSPPTLDEGFTDITKVDFEVSRILFASCKSSSATQAAVKLHGSKGFELNSVASRLFELFSQLIVNLNTTMHFCSYMLKMFLHTEYKESLANHLIE